MNFCFLAHDTNDKLSGFNNTLSTRRTWIWGLIRSDTQVVVKTVHSRYKVKWANNSAFGCAISLHEDPFCGVELFTICPQTDGAISTGVLFGKYADAPQVDFGIVSSLFIQTHVPCLGDKVYGMPHTWHKHSFIRHCTYWSSENNVYLRLLAPPHGEMHWFTVTS